jgi:hypothetical protein
MQRHARHAPATAIVLALVFAALAPVGLPGTAHACTCEGDTTISERFAVADAVFVGEAVEVRTARAGDAAEFERRYVFRVADVFKGDVYELQSVVSSTEETTCGLPWDQEGAIALVFGYAAGSATALPGELYASSCTTGPLGVLPDAPEFATARTPIDGASPIRIAAQEASPGGSVHLTWTWVAVGVLLLAGVVVGAFPRRRPLRVDPIGDPFVDPPA